MTSNLSVHRPSLSHSNAQLRLGRTIHLIDIENLCGSSRPTKEHVQCVRACYQAQVPTGAADQYVLASAHSNLLAMGLGWPRADYRVRSGHDGADIELAEVMLGENLASRFDHVIIGSGDGGLAPFAAALGSQGVRVTTVSRAGSLARTMRMAASNVVLFHCPAMSIRLAA